MFSRYSFDSRRVTVSGRNVVSSARLMPTEARGPWQLFARGRLLTRDKDLSKL